MKKILSTAAALGVCLYQPVAAMACGSTSNQAIHGHCNEMVRKGLVLSLRHLNL